MYKVFVVEDEPLIRQSLRTAIESSSGPYVFSGEAADGEMALSMMIDLQPDILITDIKMPFMDGLELARLAKESLPWLKVLIISGHDEFGYAQQAISIGVDQYLLKPIRQKELIEAVDTAVAGIEAEKRRSTLIARYDESEVQAALFRQLMHHVFFGDVSTAQMLEEAKTLGVNLVHPVHQVVLISLSRSSAPDAIRTARELLLSRMGHDIDALGLFVVPHELAFLVSADNADALAEQSYTTLRTVLHELEAGSVDSVVVLSRSVDRLSSVSDAYEDADAIIQLAGHLYTGQIVDLADRSQVPPVCDTNAGMFGTHYRKRLQRAAPEETDGILDDFLAEMDGSALQSRFGRYQILQDVYHTCLGVVEDAVEDANTGDIAGSLGSILDLVDASESRDAFTAFCRALLQRAVQARQHSIEVSKRGGAVQQAIDFINSNYSNPDISLHVVATHVGFSPSHFSMVFSQKMGRTFIDYLTSVRIDRAKELLSETDKKLSAIAMEIGYNEPNYFSYVFKKREGVSPKEFRNRVSVAAKA